MVRVKSGVSQMSPTTSRPSGTAATFPSAMLSKATGSCPFLRSQRRQALPMYPAPPVRRIFIDNGPRGSVMRTQDQVGGGREVGDDPVAVGLLRLGLGEGLAGPDHQVALA